MSVWGLLSGGLVGFAIYEIAKHRSKENENKARWMENACIEGLEQSDDGCACRMILSQKRDEAELYRLSGPHPWKEPPSF